MQTLCTSLGELNFKPFELELATNLNFALSEIWDGHPSQIALAPRTD